jgi:hypothetical protein
MNQAINNSIRTLTMKLGIAGYFEDSGLTVQQSELNEN